MWTAAVISECNVYSRRRVFTAHMFISHLTDRAEQNKVNFAKQRAGRDSLDSVSDVFDAWPTLAIISLITATYNSD